LVSADLAAIASANNITYQYTYEHSVKGFAATLTKAQLTSVRNHPRVKYVEQDQVVHLAKEEACHTQNGADWGLARIAKRELDLDDIFHTDSRLGAGVNAYIIDTGINQAHVDFEGRAVFGFNAVGSWPTVDDNGHGTHVASTVGGRLYGVAKQCDLIHVKVLDAGGSGTVAGVVAGVNYATAEHRAKGRPSIANLSLGGGKSATLENACNAASAAGVIVVVAAGNSNNNACGGSPSGATGVIGVGATDIGAAPDGAQSDVRSYFSSYGPCVHVFAPGTNILGAWIGSTTAVRTISGTSMASPHVAGACAILLGMAPGTSFSEARDYIQDHATNGIIHLACTNAICEQSPNLLLFAGCDE